MEAPRARSWLSELRGGQTRPQLFLCDDDQRWALKFADNPHGGALSLVADYVGTALASLVGVPVFESGWIEVTARALSTAPAEVQQWARPGIAFGSLYAASVAGLSGFDFGDAMTYATAPDLARIAAVDTWLEVLDRRKPDGIWNMLIDTSNAPGRLVVIDYGLCLSEPLQRTAIIGQRGLVQPQLPEEWRLWVTETDIDAACEEISSIPEGTIGALLGSVPTSWGLSNERRQAILDYLTSRVSQLNPCLRRALQP